MERKRAAFFFLIGLGLLMASYLAFKVGYSMSLDDVSECRELGRAAEWCVQTLRRP